MPDRLVSPGGRLLDCSVVALGGGHGLAASLSALRRVVTELTAVVTVADNGGSSGRLRQEFNVLPPGDLRMALAALCGDDEWGQTWAGVLQHRFSGDGEMRGHVTGNLLIVSLWEQLGDHVEALSWVGRLLGAQGRVLPMSTTPLDITARVRGADDARPDEVTEVRGQVEVATTTGQIVDVTLVPPPVACPEAVDAISHADVVVLGPGSWYTSVLPHLMVPGLAEALSTTSAEVVVSLNLGPPTGETHGLTTSDHLTVLHEHAPGLRVDTVLADPASVDDVDILRGTCERMGARLVLAPLGMADGSARHDPVRLADAYRCLLTERETTATAGDRG